MLTIRAMVRVGPWTIRGIDKQTDWTSCERCGTSIKEVWTCEVDPQAERLEDLGGKRSWAIGSKCGPCLLGVSGEEWGQAARPLKRRLRLLKKVDRLIERAEESDYGLPDVVSERRQAVIDGTATEKQMRHLGLVVGTHAKKLGIR